MFEAASFLSRKLMADEIVFCIGKTGHISQAVIQHNTGLIMRV